MDELKKSFVEYGFNDQECKGIMAFFPISQYKSETLCDKLYTLDNYFRGLGYSKDEIIKIISYFPTILAYGTIKLDEKMEFYNSLGFSKDGLFQM